MSALHTWNINFCAGYIVQPSKGKSEDETIASIQGSAVTLDQHLTNYFDPLFQNSINSCPISIIFSPTEGRQENSIRNHIKSLAFGQPLQKVESAQALALALALATDLRSQAGLFITVVGESNLGLSRIVLFKFPADESLQAIFSEQGLTINVISGAFSRKNDYFKAAVFEGANTDNTLWEGKVEDKQATERVFEVSDLWVIGFLQALPNLANERGTRTLTKATKKLLDTINDDVTRQQVIAALTTIKSQADRQITLRQFADNYLPATVREQFYTTIEYEVLFDIPFRLEQEVLDKYVGMRTIVLDNSFKISGPIMDFDNPEIVTQREIPNGEIEFIVRGRPIGDRIRQTSRG